VRSRTSSCILKLSAFALLTIGASPDAAIAQRWYEQATFSCEDPANLRPTLSSAGWLVRPLPLKFTNPAQARVWGELNDNQLLEMRAAGGDFEHLALTAEKAAGLRSILLSRSEQYDAPVIFDLSVDVIAGHALSVAGAAAAGSLVFSGIKSYLQSIAQNQSAHFRAVAGLIAAGGTLRHVVIPVTRSYKTVLSSAYVYDVKVGDEQRRVILSSCTYPVRIVVNQYMTRTGVNDLILRKQQGVWRVYRATNGAEWLAGYSLNEESEDDQWLYLRSNYSGGGSWHNQRVRISRTGGPWQVLDPEGWTNRYANVTNAVSEVTN
jgi:hypothetical protein